MIINDFIIIVITRYYYDDHHYRYWFRGMRARARLNMPAFLPVQSSAQWLLALSILKAHTGRLCRPRAERLAFRWQLLSALNVPRYDGGQVRISTRNVYTDG